MVSCGVKDGTEDSSDTRTTLTLTVMRHHVGNHQPLFKEGAKGERTCARIARQEQGAGLTKVTLLLPSPSIYIGHPSAARPPTEQLPTDHRSSLLLNFRTGSAAALFSFEPPSTRNFDPGFAASSDLSVICPSFCYVSQPRISQSPLFRVSVLVFQRRVRRALKADAEGIEDTETKTNTKIKK